MAINNFYSGDLAAITQGEIGAQNADTAAADSMRRYLLGLAMNRVNADRNNVDRERTAATRDLGFDTNRVQRYGYDTNRDISFNRAGTDERIAGMATDADLKRIAANRDIATMQDATRRFLGQGEIDLGGKRIVADTGIAQGRDTTNKYIADVGANSDYLRNLFHLQLGTDQIAANQQMALNDLNNRIELAKISQEGAIKQIQTQGAYMQPNPRLMESVLGMNMENANSNATAQAAAARANTMIPSSADELGGHIPFISDWESDYNKSVKPGGDPVLRARLLNHVMKSIGPEASALIMPTESGFVPVLRGGSSTNSPTISMKAPIMADRDALAKTIEKAQLYPADVSTGIIAKARKAFIDKWGENP